ncbi:WhiB family transcriptional regulator [Pseudonocardia parietis]|uniref:Transcriptional regulator WhiB n=1 Tax=Pseudonocardia parietis TaxID=570936 RepID=A0ABS4W266_9PSEU|nr:WhiB family transcriptional regulator [Pseudonocardia parietis]MBP2370290.1 WhiB family redox-sensing transcriptional regulator [Pseudonocardia parietis]
MRDTEARPDWLTRGACRGEDPDLHFPVKDTNYAANVAKAKALCWNCPVLQDCFRYAMAAQEELGIWAGTTNADRIKMRAAAAAGQRAEMAVAS